MHTLNLTYCSRVSWDALCMLGHAGVLDAVRCLHVASCDMLRKRLSDKGLMDGMCRVLERACLQDLNMDECNFSAALMESMSCCTSLQQLSLVCAIDACQGLTSDCQYLSMLAYN